MAGLDWRNAPSRGMYLNRRREPLARTTRTTAIFRAVGKCEATVKS